jgi:hypothetical protein
MQHPLQIDQEHNEVIREEMGERLRTILWLERPRHLPGRIRRLLSRLVEQDRKIELKPSPSIVPRADIVTSEGEGWLRRLFFGRLR